MKITISTLSTDDKELWQRLYRGYADFYQMPMTQQTLDQVWAWIFAPSPRLFALIAKDENHNGVGLMHYREMVSPLRGKPVGFLDDLYVVPDSRGSGVVDKLFDRLQLEAQQQNWPYVRWITADDNYRGRAVYDRLADKTQWVTYQLPVS
ncbi:GNAT family N-acetyltransferase [Aestuariirhabdus sp. LZHN29]|uniref:GNAT family N-acetyltransferase n=1 Tax=Aestuariirhabdus sp. LZHN29 TaxID=3417462 RepID=UPI003CF69FC7